MRKKRKIAVIGVASVMLIALIAFALTSCGANVERGELSADNLAARFNDTISSPDYFIKRTVSSYDGSKLNKDYTHIQSTSSEYDRLYFWHENTKFRNESDIQLSTFTVKELWWSETYETSADLKAGTADKKEITVWRDAKSAQNLVDGKIVNGNEENIADYKIESKDELLGGMLKGYKIDAILEPFIELLSLPEHYEIIDMSRTGMLDFYTIKVKESYNAIEGERDENYDVTRDYYLSEIGSLKITVINTETSGRISSIDNIDDKSSAILYETYFSYAAPPIGIIKCAEDYVNSVNNPGGQEKDMTLIYVIVGLACGLGIPLIALLIWFIVRKFRFFKDFDPETMDIDDYIRIKKGMPTASGESDVASGEDELATTADKYENTDNNDKEER